jgi:hypothetical protein
VAPVVAGDESPVLADDLRRRLRILVRRGGRFTLVAEQGEADATLLVSLLSSRTRAVAFDQYDDVLDYESSLTARASLLAPSGRTLWSREGLSSTRGHAAVAGAVVTSSSGFQSSERISSDSLEAMDEVQFGEDRRRRARENLAKDMAVLIYGALSEGP